MLWVSPLFISNTSLAANGRTVVSTASLYFVPPLSWPLNFSLSSLSYSRGEPKVHSGIAILTGSHFWVCITERGWNFSAPEPEIPTFVDHNGLKHMERITEMAGRPIERCKLKRTAAALKISNFILIFEVYLNNPLLETRKHIWIEQSVLWTDWTCAGTSWLEVSKL